jgi:signal transduction histidine kinase/ligand-binding sensor domain-containing protein
MKNQPFIRVTVGILLGVVISLTTAFGLFAQTLDAQVIRVNHPDLEKRNVSAITQDTTGYLYFGSSSGIRRYDGRSVKVIRTGTREDRRDINNPVKSMYPMEDGTIWAVLQSGGLAWFNSTSDSVTYVYPPNVSDQNVVWIDFRSIERKSENELLIGSYDKSSVYVFNVNTQEFTQHALVQEQGVSEYSITDLEILSTGELWIGTDMAGIVVYDKNMNQTAQYDSESANLVFDSIRDIEEDADGFIWVSTYTGGLHKFDPETRTFTRPNSLYADRTGRFGNVYDILTDNEGQLWASTDDGLVVLNTRNENVVYHFTYDPYSDRSLGNNQVRTLFRDRNGSIWVGNEHGGVHRVSISRFFRHGNPEPEKNLTQGLPTVRSFFQLNDSTLWVGTQTAGIRIMSYPDLEVIGNIAHNSRIANGLSNNGVTYMYRDNRGLIWIGTWGGGLNVYNPNTGNFTVYKPDPNDPYSISDDRIQFITQGSLGAFWIGTEGGLNLFTPSTGRFERFQSNPDDPRTLTSNSIQSLGFVEDKNNPQIFWIGTWYGLNKFDRDSGTFERYFSDPVDMNTVASNHILSIHDDGEGYLWLATFGGGLNRFEKSTGKVKVYLISNGLPSNVIFAIQPDENGYLWLSTNNGISRFEPSTESFRNYGLNEGVIGTEFWWGSSYKLSDGNILFGSTYGFTLFNPAEINETTIDPPLVINEVRTIFGDVDISSNSQIKIDYDESVLSIEYAALDFVNASRIQYAYIMEGLEDNWNYVGNVNIANFSNLPGGDYTFKVKSTNSDGIWSDDVVELNIQILPPFWQTTWFHFVSILALLLSIVGIIFLRTRQIEKRNSLLEIEVSERTKELTQNQEELQSINDELKQQAQWLIAQKTEIENQQELILSKSQELQSKNDELIRINEEKNSLVGIVAHDLRSPLASIMSGIQLIRMQPELSPEEMEKLLNPMEELLNKQLSMIARILDTEAIDSGKSNVKLERVDVNSIIKKLLPQTKKIAESKSITIRSVLAPGMLYAIADAGYLEQIVDNLVNNAIKFSPKQSVVIILSEVGDDAVRIGVKDYGPGISLSDQKKLFRKFNKLTAKPTAGESTTGLGLSIVKRFVDDMNGRVWCDSELGEGSTFWVELPQS